jgi:hypothetical protein
MSFGMKEHSGINGRASITVESSTNMRSIIRVIERSFGEADRESS